jgi:SAM-dependent methyltransferase
MPEGSAMPEASDGARTYVWRGVSGPFDVVVEPGVFVPSSTSKVLAEALRVDDGDVVVDAGCGCGVLSLVAARLGAAKVVGTDASVAAVNCSTNNAVLLGLSDRAEFRAGHLLEPLGDVRANVIIADVSGIPDAVAQVTGWFPDGKGGGRTGAELPVEMLAQVADYLVPGGRVYLPTGTIQDDKAILAAAHEVFGAAMEPVAKKEFPLPDVVATSANVRELIDEGAIHLSQRGSRLSWELTIWCCTLQSR